MIILKYTHLAIAILASALLLSGCGTKQTKKPSAQKPQTEQMTYHIRKGYNYTQPSETKPYPKKISKLDRIIVSRKHQRAYLQKPTAHHQYRTIYTFYVSTGKNDKGRRTPKGTYHINNVHSKWFYSASEHEGAKNGVGFLDGGTYLFHETPSNKRQQIIKPVARELGRKGTSYGCVHLSIPDSQWFYSHAPQGMRVIIK